MTNLEIIEEIYKRQGEIMSNINRESIDVYVWLKDEYEKRNINNAIQFSFATKLLHTIDNSRPIFDAKVSVVIHKARTGNSKETKIKSARKIYDYLEDLYSKLDKSEKIQEIVKKFRTEFCINTKKITGHKIFDFIIWSLGKLKRKN